MPKTVPVCIINTIVIDSSIRYSRDALVRCGDSNKTIRDKTFRTTPTAVTVQVTYMGYLVYQPSSFLLFSELFVVVFSISVVDPLIQSIIP